MCRPSSIRLQVSVLVYFKGAMALYLVILGFSTASDVAINLAFGTEFRGYGTGMVWMGMFSGLACIPHKWSTEKHNRFGLMAVFIVDTLVLCIQLSLGFKILSYLAPLFPKDLQLDCLRNTPLIYDLTTTCQDFFQSDRLSGMYLYWKYWYTRNGEPLAFQKITILEGDTCCGFYPPFQCNTVEDKRPFPVNRDITVGFASDLVSQRVTCGPYKGFYPEAGGGDGVECSDFYDIVAGIVGGCNYDHALGYCLKNPISPDSGGCASNVEDLMVSTITPTSYFVIGSTLLNLYAMLITCCLWWKRKANDVFPDVNIGEGDIKFEDVRDQFEVKPLHNVLVKQGFLPETDRLRLKYMEQQQASAEASLHLSVKAPVLEEGKLGEDEGPLPPEEPPSNTPSAP